MSEQTSNNQMGEYLDRMHAHIREAWEQISSTETFPALNPNDAQRKAYDFGVLLEQKTKFWQKVKLEDLKNGEKLKTFSSELPDGQGHIWFEVQLQYGKDQKLTSAGATVTSKDETVGLIEEYLNINLHETPYLYYSIGPYHEEEVAKTQIDNVAAPGLIRGLIDRIPIEN